MRKIVLGLLVTLLLAACSQQAVPIPDPQTDLAAQANTWQKLGGAIDATIDKTPLSVKMLLDRTEKPVVASLEDDNKGNYKVYFQKWTGTAWQSFAPSIIVSKSSTSFDFQIDLNNRPVVAVTKTTSSGLKDVVYRYENNLWKQLGDPANAPNLSPVVDLVIAPNGNIFTLVGDNTANKSFIRRWTGTTWQTLYTFQKITTTDYAGSPLSSPIAHAGTSLSFTKTNKPVVTWSLTNDEWAYAATPLTQVEVWNGSGWTHMGDFWGEMILDKNDKLLTATIDAQFSSSPSCGMNVAQGTSYLPKLADATKSSSVSIALDSSNRPVVAHEVRCAPNADGYNVDAEESKQDLVIRRWSGTSWQTLGGVVDRLAGKGAESMALVVDSKNTVYSLFSQCVATNGGICTNQNLYLSKYVP
jgi:hypothetical protein